MHGGKLFKSRLKYSLIHKEKDNTTRLRSCANLVFPQRGRNETGQKALFTDTFTACSEPAEDLTTSLISPGVSILMKWSQVGRVLHS